MNTPYILRRSFMKSLLVFGISILIFVGAIGNLETALKKVRSHKQLLLRSSKLAMKLKMLVRKVFLSRDSMIYRYPDALGIFTDQGGAILSARTTEEFNTRIHNAEADAFIFTTRSINTLWSDTYLFEFLIRNWIRIDPNMRHVIFVNPRLQ